MPKFDTPEPIHADVDIPGGDVRISASDRADTVVEVRPRDSSDDLHVQTARDTVVEYAGGRLLVKAPRTKGRSRLLEWGASLLAFGSGAIDVTIDLPTGSSVDVKATMAKIRCQGRLGEARIKSGFGDTRLEETGRLKLETTGDISVERAAGPADVSTASGDVWIGEVEGTAVVKSASGDLALGTVTGDAQLRTAAGDITVEHAGAAVIARTSAGEIRVGELARGTSVLESGAGEIGIGVREGTAAWLDVQTRYGTVRNELASADAPATGDETAEVRARTGGGDVVIHRA